jgi:hypothetical protein
MATSLLLDLGGKRNACAEEPVVRTLDHIPHSESLRLDDDLVLTGASVLMFKLAVEANVGVVELAIPSQSTRRSQLARTHHFAFTELQE